MKKLSKTLATYYTDARHRAGRRKSPWNLLLLALGFGIGLVAGYELFKLVWLFHVMIYPEHQLRDFWQKGISFPSFILSFLMVFSLMPTAIITGFLFTNTLFWLIKPIRRVLDKEAHGYSGTSFGASMRLLLRIAAWVLPIGLGLSLVAAFFLRSLQ